MPNELREKAIFWLGQRNDAETGEFLRSLYGQMNDAELKNKVIFAMSQRRGGDNAEWLLNVAADANEDVEVRKQALFWAGQHRAVPLDRLISLYDRTSGREMKEQLIFVYSQRRDAAAVDKLMAIARSDSDSELRKRAVFWLGQSKDPRAARFLLEIINN